MHGSFHADSLLGRLDRHADEYPDQTVYTFLRDQGEPETLTFRQLVQRVRAIAARLGDQFRPGDRALLLYPQGLEFICSYLGCLAAGMVAVPAYPPRRNRKANRLNGMIADCSPSALLTVRSIRATFPTDLADIPVLVTDEWPTTEAPPWDAGLIRPDTVAFLQYTSGSTGDPKGVMVTHGNIACNEQQICDRFHNSHKTVKVSWLPLFHDMGLIDGALQGVYVGFPSVLLAPTTFAQNPVRWLQAVSEYAATVTGGPNFAFDLCARMVTVEQKVGIDLSSLRVLYNGAEPVRGDTLDRFAAAFAPCGLKSCMFFPCYGMAETTLFVSGGPPEEEPKRVYVDAAALETGRIEAAEPDAAGAKCLVGCGVPAAGVDLRVVDPETRRLALAGRVGEIWIRSGCVAAGYWNRADDTQVAFQNRLEGTGEGPFLATGDLGFLDAGEVYVTGRVKDLIIIRGRNIYPQDVEAVVTSEVEFIEPNGCAAFAVEGPEGEEVIGIVAEADRGLVRTVKSEPTQVEIIACRIRTVVAEEFEVAVGRVVFVRPGSFPRTSSGKVQRRACRDGLRTAALDIVYDSGTAGQQPAQGLIHFTNGDPAHLAELHRVFQQTLLNRGLSPRALSPDESLLCLGFDSLDVATAVVEFEKATGVRLSPEIVYEYHTINLLATYLGSRIAPAHLDKTNQHARVVGQTSPLLGPEIPYGQDPLDSSLADHSGPSGRRLKERVAAYNTWRESRRRAGVWPFHRLTRSPAAPSTSVGDEQGTNRTYLNFGSQDYLGLARDPRVLRKAQEAVTEYGVHSAGSPVLLGSTTVMVELERSLAAALGKEDCMVYPTGWAAGFGVITGLVRGHDNLLLDSLSHRCLMEGAYHVSREPLQFRHNDLDQLRQMLRQASHGDRARDVFVVAESLYSMDADSPALVELVRAVQDAEGILILDVAHDFGAVGARGLGVLERLDGTGLSVDVVMGSFSKTFAATGGFVAADREVIEYLRVFSTPYVFSNAISPVQAAAALECCRIAFSEEGNRLRDLLMSNVRQLRSAMQAAGFRVGGAASPIVPVFVGEERVARLTARQIARNGLLANLVEYPAVPRGAARFRFQVMSTHTLEMAQEATAIFARSYREAAEE